MANADCLPQVHACRMRLTHLNPNGSIIVGAGHMYVTSALTKLTVTPNYRQGTEIEEPNGCDQVCVAYKPPPSLKWGDVAVEVCTPDPNLEHFLGGGAVILGDGGEPNGYAAPAIGPIATPPVSIEIWSKRILNGDLDPDFPYAWWVYPKVVDLASGARTHEAPSKKPTFDGRALENENWFDGPLNDWPATMDRYEQWIPTTTLPAATCGAGTVPAS